MCPDQPHSSCDLAMYGGNVQRYDEGQKIYHWSEKAQGRLFEQNFTSKHQSDCRVTLKVQQIDILGMERMETHDKAAQD